MARKIKITRKEVMEPDAFVTFGERAALFFSEHRSLIIGSLIGVMAVAAAWAGFSYSRNASALKMETLLFEMEKAKGGVDGKADIGGMKTTLERIDAGPYRIRGTLILADAEYDSGSYDEALKRYQEVLDGAASGSLNYFVALQGLGYAHLSRQEYDKAIEAFRSLIDRSKAYPLFDIYSGLVRSYEGKQDSQNALLILHEMEGRFQGHPQLAWVERRIKKLTPGV